MDGANRRKLLLAALAVVAAGAIAFRIIGGGFLSERGKINAEMRKVMDEKEKIDAKFSEAKAQERDKAKEMAELQKAYDGIIKETSAYEAKIPSAGSVTRLLGEITRRSEGLGMDFESIKQSIEREKEGYLKLKLDMRFAGPYSSVVNYLNRLQNLSDYLRVSDIEISQTKEGASRAKTNMQLSMLLLEKGVDLTVKEKEEKFEPVVLKLDPFVSKKSEKKDKTRDFKLAGITQAGENSTAIINDEVVKVGAKIGDWKVVKILQDAVTLSDGIETVSITLNR